MSVQETLNGLEYHLPVSKVKYNPKGKKVGLVIVDEVVGFCSVGGGNLAPPVPNQQISNMVTNTADLARKFLTDGNPIFAFRDTHVPGRAEPPYPEHCVKGSGEEQLVPELKFLEEYEETDRAYGRKVTFLDKDCINGFVGAIDRDFHHSAIYEVNQIVEWLNFNEIETLVVTGICTSICVLDFVVSILSARNHYYRDGVRMLRTLQDVVVYEPACSDYDLPRETATAIGLPVTASHPQALVHHVGLSIMQARGAIIARELT